MSGRRARVGCSRPLNGGGANRRDVADREAPGCCGAKKREIRGEGARGLGKIDEKRALAEAGGHPAPGGAGGYPDSGGNLGTGAPQESGDVGGGAGIEQQRHGARFFGLARNKFTRVDEGAMQVGYAVGVPAEAHVEAAWRDEPRAFEPVRLAEVATLLLEPALREYPPLLVANGSYDDLDLGAQVVERAVAARAVGR